MRNVMLDNTENSIHVISAFGKHCPIIIKKCIFAATWIHIGKCLNPLVGISLNVYSIF